MCPVYWPLCIVGILLAGVCCSAPANPSAQKPLCYVSPAGNDQWSGKLPAPNAAKTDGPLATIATAQSRLAA